ncbi:hypothetical protein F8M41_023592 [Gigaspora margarita]|uniref:Uncharacterized protein n=1 Tax=Gigaspora margarita TaxID=4874 RepID=A0A8H4AD69_GIGMA|nr:hypothetical protein F8M41_023592 [Gigaspora margarita]
MSNWQKKFENFEVITSWKKYKNSNKPNYKLNEYRLMKINFKLYLKIKTQKPEITFLCNIKYFNLIKNYTWYSIKRIINNTYYIKTNITNKSSILFYRMIYSEWKMINYINHEGCDNCEINLRDSSNGINQKNYKLFKNNTSRINGTSFNKSLNAWIFQ